MRVGFVEGVLPVMFFYVLVQCFFLPFDVLCVVCSVFFVANFSGAFCLNVVRICWGCCDLTIWIWGKCCVKVVYDFLVFYSFHFFISFLLLFYLFWVRFVQVFFYVVGFFRVLTFCFLKSQFYKWDIQPFLSVSQVFVVCIVHSVPALFVLILLGDFLYNAVYTHNIFYIMPFH